MHNPETTQQQIFEGGISVRKPHWDFREYKTPADYLGKQIKPGVQKATKKGFYMDYMLKVSKGVPSAQHYKTMDNWSTTKKSTQKPDLKARRMSYIDQIQLSQKKKKSTPGVGSYKLMASDKQVEAVNKKLHILSEKRKDGSKRFFYQDTQYVSNQAPGPGNYNPHQIRKKQQFNKTDPEFWKVKHSEEIKEAIRKSKTKPDPALYTPTFNGTFETLYKQSSSKKNTTKPWGSSSRFRHYEKVCATKNNPNEEVRPSPATYDMSLLWRGKSLPLGKTDQKKKDWFSITSRAKANGVYH